MSLPIKNFYEFGRFRLDTEERALLRDGKPLPLTPKDYEILLALVERSGRITEKDELMRRVWPDTSVGEENLARHVSTLRKMLGEEPDEQGYIETIPKRGYRFIAGVKTIPIENVGSADLVVETHTISRIISEVEEVIEPAAITLNQSPAAYLDAGTASGPRFPYSAIRNPQSAIRIGLALAALVVAAGLSVYWWNRPALTDKDTILLADFVNQTGDAVFDGTLKQGLAVQVEQSPFLTTFSEAQVRHALRLMSRPAEEQITGEIAREICLRQGLKALITGSIASLGSHYVITLEAVSHSGQTLARAQTEAEGKEQVLKALSQAASSLRKKLGESLSSIQKFDAPLQYTTSSLEALQVYSLGAAQAAQGHWLEAIPFYKRATELDPNFASAYLGQAFMYAQTYQPERAAEQATKAFALRDRVSEIEKLRITSNYYSYVTGEIDKAIEVVEMMKRIYTRDDAARVMLSSRQLQLGKIEKAAAEAREALRLNPHRAVTHAMLGRELIYLNQFADAEAMFQQAIQQKLDSTRTRVGLYELAFASGDQTAMQRQIDWANGRPDEYVALNWQASAAAFLGQWRRSQEFAQRAIGLTVQDHLQEVAARYASESAKRGASLGQCAQIKETTAQALSIERSRDSLSHSSLALALCGEVSQTQALVDELLKQYPKDTLLNSIWIPVIRAAIELQRGNARQAITLLQPASRYEAAAEFWPQYLRGQAYLRLLSGNEAAAEFRKILDHRGQAMLSVLYPLAYLGLARTMAMTGDAAGSRKAYEDFFSLWKDADADLPVLIEAKKESGTAPTRVDAVSH